MLRYSSPFAKEPEAAVDLAKQAFHRRPQLEVTGSPAITVQLKCVVCTVKTAGSLLLLLVNS